MRILLGCQSVPQVLGLQVIANLLALPRSTPISCVEPKTRGFSLQP